MNKLFKNIILFALAFHSSAQAELNVGEKISEAIQSEDIKFDLNLFSLKAGDSVELSSETGIRVFPNQDLKTYSRIEPLIFNLDIGHNISQGAFYVGARRASGLSGEFIRKFETQSQAFNVLKFPPYILEGKIISAHRIPFTSDRAQSLAVNDYFRYQLRTAITISGGLGSDIGVVNLSANKSYVVYGDLQIEVYKKGPNKVLVRASSLKKKEKSLSLNLRKNFILELFEIKALNKAANSLIPSELVRLDLSTKSDGSLFAVEYEFDLSQDSAQLAYNQLMDFRKWSFWDVEKVISGSKAKALKVLSINLQSVEAHAKSGAAGVQRVVRSSTHFREHSEGSSFNFRLVKGKDQTQHIEQNISLASNPMSDDRRHYRIATVIDLDDIGGWLLFKSGQKEQKEANILFELNEKLQVRKLLELNFLYERSDDSFNLRNQNDTAGQIYALLPGALHGPGVRDFVQGLKKFHKDEVYVNVELSLEPRALAVVNRLSAHEMQQVVLDHIDRVFNDQSIGKIKNRDYGNLGLSLQANNHYKADIEKMLELIPLAIQLSGGKSYDAQWSYQVKLQSLGLYKKIGPGLMTRLLMAGIEKKSNDPDQFYRYAKLKLHARSRDGGVLTYEKGRDDQMLYIQEILKIRNRILNRSYDPIYFE